MTTNTINTNENITNNSFITTINQHFSQVLNLKQEKIDKTAGLYAQISVIEKDFNSQIYAIEKEINDIKERYSSFAHELAIKDGKCPCSRWGGDLEPNEVDINEEGIHLTWIQENNYDGMIMIIFRLLGKNC